MLKFLRKLAAPALGALDKVNEKFEPFKDPDMSQAVLPPLDTLQFKLAITSDACRLGLHKHIKSDVFFWDVVNNGNGNDNDLGDNCLWQGVYLAYLANIGDIGQVTKVLVEGMIPLSTYAGPGVLVRGIAHKNDFKMPANDPRYFMVDGCWVCLDDASMGSLLGFCYGLTYALKSPKTCGLVDKDLIRKLAERVADTVIANDFKLIKRDGTPTTWGNLNPGVTQVPSRILGLLALLKLAGKEDLYSKIYNESEPVLEYGETHLSLPGYAWNPWYQHHLAFLTYDMLLMLETDKRRDVYLKGLKRLWDKYRKWWNVYFIAVAAKYLPISDNDFALAMAGLFDYEYPAIKIQSKTNSTNSNITKVTYDGKLMAERALRINARPPTNYLWQRNPFQLDGSPVWGYSGLDFLFPYSIFVTWVPRFLKDTR